MARKRRGGVLSKESYDCQQPPQANSSDKDHSAGGTLVLTLNSGNINIK